MQKQPQYSLKDNKFFIRKDWCNATERRVSLILKDNPHPNIATVYDVVDYGIGDKSRTDTYVDIEMVNTHIDDAIDSDLDAIHAAMHAAKEHLHKHGIMYMNWSYDNIGRGDDGEYKLFDFHAAGISDVTGEEWVVEPVRNAQFGGLIYPVSMDDDCFQCFLHLRSS